MDETNNQNQNSQNQTEETKTSQSEPVMDFTKGSNNNMVMGILSYLGPLVIVPYMMNKDNDFVKFHTKQGLVLFGIEVIVWVIGSMMLPLMMIMSLVNLATLVLSIIGIVNVVQNNKKELPIIGSLAHNLKF